MRGGGGGGGGLEGWGGVTDETKTEMGAGTSCLSTNGFPNDVSRGRDK